MGRSSRITKRIRKSPCFIDIFAGCGGLSLGLMNAGWVGKFAIEKNRDAFDTLATNLVDGRLHTFNWPKWLPKAPSSTAKLLAKFRGRIGGLRGKIDLIAGAPPCQGFSSAGRRLHSDPRNSLFRQYLSIVEQIRPRFLLVENVQGFSFPFRKSGRGLRKHKAYSETLREKLREIGYTVYAEMTNFSEFGVPQNRNRFILVAIKNGDPSLSKLRGSTPFDLLRRRREAFLRSKHLSLRRRVSVRQAIFDLEVEGKSLVSCSGEPVKGFEQIEYVRVGRSSSFVRLMRRFAAGPPNSIRLPRHAVETIRQFQRIMMICRKGQSLRESDRKQLGIKKHVLTPLHPGRPASTVTTLPDDLIHYSEPRILTVRENARLQSFPDWFEFKGKYTTGGKARRSDCPRYTQVGNAVPPLFAEAIGLVLRELAR
jgi:DNA (cytosine-5)-methyltransferase 1